eukprot:5974486-Ditylum_brightwellii.AAC.1
MSPQGQVMGDDATVSPAIYIYEKSEKLLKKLRYTGSYHDDGLAIFNHRMSTWQAIHWLCRFQLQ